MLDVPWKLKAEFNINLKAMVNSVFELERTQARVGMPKYNLALHNRCKYFSLIADEEKLVLRLRFVSTTFVQVLPP